MRHCTALARRATDLADAMRFEFLYDSRRRIFSIGYRLPDAEGAGRRDTSFYDLLASEARLASFVAIAKGDVPQHHWFHLGRHRDERQRSGDADVVGRDDVRVFDAGAAVARLSGDAARSELPRQRPPADRIRPAAPRAMGDFRVGVFVDRPRRQLSVPGVRCAGSRPEAGARGRSRRRAVCDGAGESHRSRGGGDQSRPAGAGRPRGPLRLLRIDRLPAAGPSSTPRRGPSRRRRPRQSCARSSRTIRACRWSPLPTSSATTSSSSGSTPIHGCRRPSCCSRSACRARRFSPSRGRPRPRPALPSAPMLASRRFRTPHTASPHTHFLSNGRYTTALTHAGGGSSTWRGLMVTRRREDRTSDAGAHFIYLRDPWSGDGVVADAITRSAASRTSSTRRSSSRRRPTGAATAISTRSSRSSSHPKTTSRCGVCRSPTAATGRGRSRSRATPRSCWPVRKTTSRIPPSASCSSKPSTTRRARACSSAAARARPTKRTPGRSTCSAVDGRLGGAVEWETDRERFIGRGRSPANPIALDGRALSGTTGAVLDPVAALRERVRLAPGAFVRVTFATGVAPDRDVRAGAGAQVPRRQRGRARVLDGLDPRAHHAAASRA